MAIDFLYPQYEVVRNYDRCIACRACERQCANEVHFYDPEFEKMMASVFLSIFFIRISTVAEIHGLPKCHSDALVDVC